IWIMVFEAGKPDQVNVMLDFFGNPLPWETGNPETKGDIVHNGLPGQQSEMLEDDGDALTRRADRLTIDQNFSRPRRQQPADAAEQRCLAAAGRTDDAKHLIAAYVQLNVAKGDDCSFEEKLAGVIHNDLRAIGHRKALL